MARSVAIITLTRVCALASSPLCSVATHVIRGLAAISREILPRIPFLLACSGHLRGAGDLTNYLLESFVPVKWRTLSFSRYLPTDRIDHHHAHCMNESDSIRIIDGNDNLENHHVTLAKKARRLRTTHHTTHMRPRRILYCSANCTPKNNYNNFMSPFLTVDINPRFISTNSYTFSSSSSSSSSSSKRRRAKGRKLTYSFSFPSHRRL